MKQKSLTYVQMKCIQNCMDSWNPDPKSGVLHESISEVYNLITYEILDSQLDSFENIFFTEPLIKKI